MGPFLHSRLAICLLIVLMHGTHANKYVMYLTYFYLYTHMCLCVCVHKERGSGTCGFTRSLAEQKYNKDSMQQIVA